MYAVVLVPDDNDTLLVACPDLPEVTTFGENEEDALRRAADAIEEALAARIAHRDEIPLPSARIAGPCVVLPPMTVAKVQLYQIARARGETKASLGRALGWHGPQVDRLFDLRHPSKMDQLDRALHAMGKRLVVTTVDAE